MSDQTDIASLATQMWLRDALASGRALEIVQSAGVTFAEVAEYCDVSTPTAWCWLQGRIERPHREHARRLANLLTQLETMVRDA